MRFSGFDEPWKERKLSELIIEYKETVDSDCVLPVLTSSKTEGVVLQEDHFGNRQNHDITGYNVLPKNYCTYRNRSDGVDFTFNINKCCDKGIISKFYPVFYGNNSDIFFISLVLNNVEKVIREIGYTCKGTGQKVLSFGDLQKMNIKVPSYDEQKKISKYIENLDHLITLHQRKIDILKKYKSGLLQQMFPQNGELVPRLRFPGFTAPWQQHKLGELVSFSKGSGYSKGDLKEYGTPIILYGRLYTKYETIISKVDTFVDEKNGSVYSKGGEVIVPASGETAEDISIASVVEKSGILLGGDLNVIMPPDDLDSAFLAISISNGKPHNDMSKMAQGKSVVHLHNSDLAKIALPYPQIEEQQQISGYFSNIDRLIALHQHKYDLLLRYKNGLLQKMFT